ncbi:MAG TPA: ABC transporter permease [Casimicrobiaceae bacterium]|jgi:ABC-type nitrate/sulfonate/bicarbonate transport system permease component|nr:ABC transporter permease [Casimicrobiaceae bacterium]
MSVVVGARARRRGSLGGAFVYLRTMTVFAIVWALVAWWTENPILLPSPLAVAQAAVDLARSLELFQHAAISLGRMVISITIASALAIPLGLAMGLSRRFERVVDPTLEVLRPISGIAWIPLALFIFGIGNTLPVFIMTYAAFFPIVLGTVGGVRAVDRRLIDAARTMGVPHRTIVTRVVIPAALPSLLVALRLGVALSWTAVVAAELIGAPSGLGYAVEWYRELLATPQVMSFIAMIGVIGYICDAGVRWLNRRFTPWVVVRP